MVLIWYHYQVLRYDVSKTGVSAVWANGQFSRFPFKFRPGPQSDRLIDDDQSFSAHKLYWLVELSIWAIGRVGPEKSSVTGERTGNQFNCRAQTKVSQFPDRVSLIYFRETSRRESRSMNSYRHISPLCKISARPKPASGRAQFCIDSCITFTELRPSS